MNLAIDNSKVADVWNQAKNSWNDLKNDFDPQNLQKY